MSEDPIYMEKRALEFLRQWPEVDPLLRPVYSRFYDAGLIWVDPNVDDGYTGSDWPGALRLTEHGRALKEIVDGQTFNFFTRKQIVPLLPNGDLTEFARRIFKDDLPHPKIAKVLPRKPVPLLEAIDKAKYAQAMLQYRIVKTLWCLGAVTDDLNDDIPF